MTTHTQINTCPHCGKSDHWEVLESVPVYDWHQWCFDCINEIGVSTQEPADASGYADVEVIVIQD